MENYDMATLFFMTIIELLPWAFLVFIGIKRLHDCDYKGWWVLIPFVVLAIWFVKPTQGINRFGTDPRDEYFYDEIEVEKDHSFWGVVIIALLYNFGLISTAIDKQNRAINHQDNATYQDSQSSNIQTPSISPNDIKTPNINHQTQLNPQLVLAKAKNDYDNAVANINAVWNSLHPNTRYFLRAEQKAVNKKREEDCTAYGNAQSNDKDLAIAYRYICEVPQLNERAEYLKTQLNTVVTPPAPKNVGPAYRQTQQTKDEFVLSQMMNVYNNPQSAPYVYLCQGNIYCNAFSALSQYWIHIPDNYRYQGEFNIKYQAQIGDAYGLNKGFALKKEQSFLFLEGGNLSYGNSGENMEQEKTLAEGLAVLLYIEDMNGWS